MPISYLSKTDKSGPTVSCTPVEDLPGFIKVGYAVIKTIDWIEGL